jgi:mRNA interferase MazF
LPVSGVVLADHVKCLDWRTRRAEYIGEAPEGVVAEVVRRLGLLLGGAPA